ncbi:MAG: hypothetical protein A7316_10125 [Candidatus Altiarchaeales archaeon WOR_SM1_86-2]|nr:MAG: hypothetical protein A7316_10125 [Candidatus Altiarchaeales archaeon WOR_SM1_86-2]ODS38285.1 MAG: hypothetical protein A7315_12650 [Candidatus Altiarchaeales archaeon WOR_SM1_79]
MNKAISVYTDGYTEYVVGQLVGIKGKSKSDVVNYILKTWMEVNKNELNIMGIDIQKAKDAGVFKK